MRDQDNPTFLQIRQKILEQLHNFHHCPENFKGINLNKRINNLCTNCVFYIIS